MVKEIPASAGKYLGAVETALQQGSGIDRLIVSVEAAYRFSIILAAIELSGNTPEKVTDHAVLIRYTKHVRRWMQRCMPAADEREGAERVAEKNPAPRAAIEALDMQTVRFYDTIKNYRPTTGAQLKKDFAYQIQQYLKVWGVMREAIIPIKERAAAMAQKG